LWPRTSRPNRSTRPNPLNQHNPPNQLNRPNRSRPPSPLFGLAAVFAFLVGPGLPPKGIRKIINTALDAIGHTIGASGIPLGPVPTMVKQYRRVAPPIAIAVIFFNPGIGTLRWSVFWVLIALIVEIIARAEKPPALVPVAA
jgi:hypothetical protein